MCAAAAATVAAAACIYIYIWVLCMFLFLLFVRASGLVCGNSNVHNARKPVTACDFLPFGHLSMKALPSAVLVAVYPFHL